MAATAADFPSGKAEPTQLGMHPIRRRQRRMRGNLPGPEGLARRGASAALHGLQPLPLLANAAHADYSDRLLVPGTATWSMKRPPLVTTRSPGFRPSSTSTNPS